MKTAEISTTGINFPLIVMGSLAALLILSVLTGRKVPLLNTDRAALLGLVVIGLAICSMNGIGKVAASGQWLHPLSITGYLLGTVILVIGLGALFGKVIPPLTNFHQSFLAVTLIAGIKLALTTIHRLFL